MLVPAAFGRLCVETLLRVGVTRKFSQPPSGGCVLKPLFSYIIKKEERPAAFGRLCVETEPVVLNSSSAAPAAFGRLCVETWAARGVVALMKTSRLRAAVC